MPAAAYGNDALRLLAAGQYEVFHERYGAACTLLERALAGLDAAQVLLRVELLALLTEAQIGADRLADAERNSAAAAQAAETLRAEGCPLPVALMARIALNRARIGFWRREHDAAATDARVALDLLRSSAPHPGSALLLIHAHGVLAVNLSLSGRHDEAIELNRAAGEVLDAPGLRYLGRERVMVAMNLANAEHFAGRHDDARAHFHQAIALATGLIEAGSKPRVHDLGRTLMNLGGLELNAGHADAAFAAYERALALYDAEIGRVRRRRGDARRLEASRASTRMNLGYACFRNGQYQRAGQMLRLAMRDYARMKATVPHLEDDEARAAVNQAHLLLADGKPQQAARRYAAAVATWQRRLAEGRSHLRADLANARLGLARTLIARRQFDAAAGLIKQGLAAYVDLTHEGQLQHARAWLDAWLGNAEAAVQAHHRRSGDAAAPLAAVAATLVACLDRPAQRALPIGDDQPRQLLTTIDRIGAWPREADARSPWTGLASALIRHLLGWIAVLLGDSDPQWLGTHGRTLLDAVGRLRALAWQQPDAAALLADWFICTRGLRAQRDALAASSDPQVRDFALRLAQLRRIEEDMLGRLPLAATPDSGLLSPLGANVAPAGGAEPAGEWLDLRRRCDIERQRLAGEGLLPHRLRPGWQELAAHLPRDSALCLLARPQPSSVTVIVVHRAQERDPRAWAADAALPEVLHPIGSDQLLGLVRRALAGAGARDLRRAAEGGTAEPPDHSGASGRRDFAIEMLRALVNAASAPLAESVARLGLRELVVVPSDDLHCVPWHDMIGNRWATRCRIVLHPSVGSWLRSRVDPSHAPAPLRWAMAAAAETGAAAPLPWVRVEAALSRRLWQGLAAPPKEIDAQRRRADGVTALIGMGHGALQEGNWSASGLALDGAAVLTAHDLPHIRTSRRLLLSCCVLGQTQDILGEPLGFLSAGFGYGVEFGCGWLTEVPDRYACLFSIAFQFALRQAIAATGDADWGAVFETTRQGVQRGSWPPGFGSWLKHELATVTGADPASAAGAGLDAPPEGLRQMMTWVMHFGR